VLARPTLEKMRWVVKLLGGDSGRCPVAEITPQQLLHELQKHERLRRSVPEPVRKAFVNGLPGLSQKKLTEISRR
jgi:hypothetical protein